MLTKRFADLESHFSVIKRKKGRFPVYVPRAFVKRRHLLDLRPVFVCENPD